MREVCPCGLCFALIHATPCGSLLPTGEGNEELQARMTRTRASIIHPLLSSPSDLR